MQVLLLFTRVLSRLWDTLHELSKYSYDKEKFPEYENIVLWPKRFSQVSNYYFYDTWCHKDGHFTRKIELTN